MELSAGAALVALAAALWVLRAAVRRRLASGGLRPGRSALLLGAGIMAVELPTALPYVAALAAVIGSGRGLPAQLLLLLLYNGVFVAPLAGIVLVRWLAGARGARLAAVARAGLDRHAPVVTPALLFALGVGLAAAGASAL